MIAYKTKYRISLSISIVLGLFFLYLGMNKITDLYLFHRALKAFFNNPILSGAALIFAPGFQLTLGLFLIFGRKGYQYAAQLLTFGYFSLAAIFTFISIIIPSHTPCPTIVTSQFHLGSKLIFLLISICLILATINLHLNKTLPNPEVS
jgi:uncharacterized membrane protein YphA (DoxX/SURF4 family)